MRPLSLILVFTIFLHFKPILGNSEGEDGVEAHFESILDLHNKFRDLDQEMSEICEENPGKDFMDKQVKPLRSKMKEFSTSLKTLEKNMAEEDFSKLKSTQNDIVSEMAQLEILFTDVQAKGDSQREDYMEKIQKLEDAMKEASEKQKENSYEEALDEKFLSTFDPRGHHSISTRIEVQVLKMSMGIIKDLAGSFKQLKEEAGEKITEAEIKAMSQEELIQELAEILILKKNEGLKPSNFLPKMMKTLDDIKEFFEAKISENYEFLSEEFAEESKKISRHWSKLQKRVQELENKGVKDKDEL